MSEKLKNNLEQSRENAEKLDALAKEKRAEIEERLEGNLEKSKFELAKEDVESSARHEALELAQEQKEKEEAKAKKQEASSPEKIRPDKPTKQELKRSFDKTMKQVQKDMSPASRTFSKVIHNPVVERVSETASNTIARPNLILAGALGTIIICSIAYFVAKKYGYVLSGSEAMLTFVFGWAVGAIIEFARVGITNRK